ncbi:MAG: PorT family protein [Chlorobi bacterium]|nr:PorT family protein [Chlorobiota bacterium]
MKKSILVLLVVVIGHSYNTIAQVTFGPKIGLNLAKYSYSYKDSDLEPDVKMRVAPMAGLAVNVQFSDQLSLQSGLFYSGKGTSYDLEKINFTDINGNTIDVNTEGYWRTSTSYIELPANLAYGFPIGNNQLQIFAGPYVAYGITGQEKMDITIKSGGDSESNKAERKIKFKGTIDESDFEGDEEVEYQTALDFGLNFGLGFKTGPILINAGYGMGFVNLTPKWGGEEGSGYDNADRKFTNTVINFSVSYFFGNKQSSKRGRYRGR